MDEFEIIRQYFERQITDDDVIAGIGDDGAVTRPAPGRDLVTVIDTLVAEVHFPRSLCPADLGYRSVAVNVSDIAAMGGRPRWMTLALTLREADPRWLGEFARGLFDAADEHELLLVGGDTTSGAETVISVQICGDVEPGAALMRSGARPGDAIYVTGTVGDAAAGLSILQSGTSVGDDAEYLVHRFARPAVRLDFARAVAPVATAAIDLSDGLFTDLEKLLFASGRSGSIELASIPISPQLGRVVASADALRFALGGGDDYELCFTTAAPEEAVREIVEESGVPATRIGRVGEGGGLACTLDGEPCDYRDDGYRHFH